MGTSFVRYAILCRDSEPVLFETVGADMESAKLDCPWMKDRVRPAITWTWSEGATERQARNMAAGVVDLLKERKVFGEKIGVDIMDAWVHGAFEEAGVKLVNAWPAMSQARVIKTVDELECLKYSAAVADECLDLIRNEWLKRPGITESQLAGNIIKYFTDRGFEEGQAFCVASGGNTNPYRRWWSDKPIRRGDLVITDIGGRGPGGGYYVDVTRTHICGDASPTPEEKKQYKETLDSLNAAIAEAWPGKTTDEAVDFEEARRILGPDYCLMGNVSTTLMAMGTAEEVSEATKEVIQKAGKDGHLIVSGGCLITEICPTENIKAMVKSAREYRI